MSVNNLFTGQQAVRVQPSVDDIFKLNVSNRFPGLIMEKGISLTAEQQLKCVEELSKLEIYQKTEQVHLNLESFQSMTVVLSNKIASTFQDGEITWQKIFQILDAVAEVIINIPEMVCLVDQLCHYSETIHVSNRGQTIAEWISSVGQEVCIEDSENIQWSSGTEAIMEWNSTMRKELHQSFKKESSRIQESDVLAESNQSMVEKPLETREEYATKCPCGSTVFWSALLYGRCKVCLKYPCVIDGCNGTFALETLLRQHLYADHTNQEETVIFEKRKRYEDIHCKHCWTPSPARGVSAHTKCSSCKRFLCLRGHCRTTYKSFPDIQLHQEKCAYFFPGNKCGFCGGEKIKIIGQLTKCPKANCTAFWCGLCNYEGQSVRSLISHTTLKHKEI